MLKPEPFVLALLILTLPLFWFVIVTVFVTLVPSWTLPKAILGGLGTMALLDAPQPVTAKLIEPFTLTLPLAVPAELGLKVTVSDALWPGARLNGNVAWLTLYTVELDPILEMVIFEEPVLVNNVGRLSELPSTTSPKRRLVGLGLNELKATAGIPKAALNKNAPSKRKTRDFETIWGRVITLPVSTARAPPGKVSMVHLG
jgi:hypothetical protein